MKKIGAAAILTAGTILLLALRGETYYKYLQDWRREKIHDAFYNSLDEKDIAWG